MVESADDHISEVFEGIEVDDEGDVTDIFPPGETDDWELDDNKDFL